jgi:selenocysteine lyase/cysteine desulfurase
MDSSEEKDVIYLDYNATTNIHEEVRKAMEPYLIYILEIHQALINMVYKLRKVYLKPDNKFLKC